MMGFKIAFTGFIIFLAVLFWGRVFMADHPPKAHSIFIATLGITSLLMVAGGALYGVWAW